MGQSEQAIAGALAMVLACFPLSVAGQEALTDPANEAIPVAAPRAVSITVSGTAQIEGIPVRNPVRIGFDTVEGAPRYADRDAAEGGAATVRFATYRPRSAGAAAAMPYGLPVPAARLTSRYGYRVHPISGRGSNHGGIDLAVATGTPVVATAGGRVVVASWSGGYGLLVAVDHGGEVETLYGHLSAVSVRPGDTVQAGQMIGRSGSTGRSTGPHVHYEVRISGYSVDPLPAR